MVQISVVVVEKVRSSLDFVIKWKLEIMEFIRVLGVEYRRDRGVKDNNYYLYLRNLKDCCLRYKG